VDLIQNKKSAIFDSFILGATTVVYALAGLTEADFAVVDSLCTFVKPVFFFEKKKTNVACTYWQALFPK